MIHSKDKLTAFPRPQLVRAENQSHTLAKQTSQLESFQPLGRLDAAQTAKLLGFQEHDIPVLVSAGLLKPLGKPVPNARKYFAAVEVMEKASDPGWPNKATQTVYVYWQTRNAKRENDASENN